MIVASVTLLRLSSVTVFGNVTTHCNRGAQKAQDLSCFWRMTRVYYLHGIEHSSVQERCGHCRPHSSRGLVRSVHNNSTYDQYEPSAGSDFLLNGVVQTQY